MINLLPPQQKEILKDQQYVRLLLILGTMVIVFLLSFLLIALSLRIYLQGEVSFQKALLVSFQESTEQSILQELKDRNNAVQNVLSFYNTTTTLTPLFEEVAGALPPELSITSFSYTPGSQTKKKGISKETRAHLKLAGLAPTRKGLLVFRENLQKSALFENMVFPPSNWVTPRDIIFSIEMDMSQ